MRRTNSNAAPAGGTVDQRPVPAPTWPALAAGRSGDPPRRRGLGVPTTAAARASFVDVREQPQRDEVGGRSGGTAPAPVGAGLGEVVEDRAGRCLELLEQCRDLVGRGSRRQSQELADDEHGPGFGEPPHECQRSEPFEGGLDSLGGRVQASRSRCPGRSRGAPPARARRARRAHGAPRSSPRRGRPAGRSRAVPGWRGRAVRPSSADSSSSDQPRSWSARVRGAVAGIRANSTRGSVHSQGSLSCSTRYAAVLVAPAGSAARPASRRRTGRRPRSSGWCR